MGKARRTRQTREQERRRARTRRMLIATGAAVVLVVALIVVQQVTRGGSNRPDPSNLAGVADVQAEFAGLTERDGTIGTAGAKVTIAEYGDLRCPICQTFDNDVVPQAGRGYVRTGKAKLRFRPGPSSARTRSRPRRPATPPPAERALALRRADLPQPG